VTQEDIIAWLADPANHTGRPAIERHDTHGAVVILAGDYAYKIKRAIAYPYMDFSTLDRRHSVLLRELEVNQPNAPDIYLDVVAITRRADGELALGGQGEPLEWALRMRRFPTADILANRFAAAPPADAMLHALARVVAQSHRRAPIVRDEAAAWRTGKVVEQLARAFDELPSLIPPALIDGFAVALRSAFDAQRGRLDRRGRRGAIRRCHGDLHLGNIVAVADQPVLFDAIEFSEDMATIDTLYDLAFLLMDLEFRGMRAAANLLLNRYLYETGVLRDLDGLAALPLFMSIRAGVRAMVALERGRLLGEVERIAASAAAEAHLRRALDYLRAAPARFVAVGGRSGTGKSTLARALAPLLGHAAGAVHLRSDLERKRLARAGETERLGPRHYKQAVSDAVYRRLHRKAAVALGAGVAAIADATYLDERSRVAAAAVATSCGVRFTGLWLQAAATIATARVAARVGDASDATPEVVRGQYARPTGPIDWRRVEADEAPEHALAAARAVLGI
jgi:hypothetical protein